MNNNYLEVKNLYHKIKAKCALRMLEVLPYSYDYIKVEKVCGFLLENFNECLDEKFNSLEKGEIKGEDFSEIYRDNWLNNKMIIRGGLELGLDKKEREKVLDIRYENVSLSCDDVEQMFSKILNVINKKELLLDIQLEIKQILLEFMPRKIVEQIYL